MMEDRITDRMCVGGYVIVCLLMDVRVFGRLENVQIKGKHVKYSIFYDTY